MPDLVTPVRPVTTEQSAGVFQPPTAQRRTRQQFSHRGEVRSMQGQGTCVILVNFGNFGNFWGCGDRENFPIGRFGLHGSQFKL